MALGYLAGRSAIPYNVASNNADLGNGAVKHSPYFCEVDKHRSALPF
jgi:hypothetical protein